MTLDIRHKQYKMWIDRLCLCLGVVVTVLADDELPYKVVNTTSGAVRGFLGQSGVYEYLDIPYATVPVGSKKFGPPLPSPEWQGIRDAVDTGIICPQPIIFGVQLPHNAMEENCLLASVFAPDTAQESLPVVVYVHGGSFQMGFGNWVKPYDLVKKHDIVAVTFNYRLGPYGFLCLGTEDIPGNAGMKDQVALLRWVQKNIASFGGNPDDVTIAGYSAGAASVDLLMLSKSAEGLFNKVIPESGANIAVFTIQSDPLESAKQFAKSLKFDNVDDIDALAEFYKTATLEQLTSDSSFMDRADSSFPFSPCVERSLSTAEQAEGKEVFLDESPTKILRNENYKKVPILYGFTNMEGLLKINYFEMWKTRMNEKFSDFLPADLVYDSEEEKYNVTKKVKEFYFGEKPEDNDNILKYVDYITDVMFAYSALRSVKLQLENGHDQIYLYEFSYVDEQTPVVPYTEVRGANHVAQTVAVFGGQMIGLPDLELTEHYKKMSSTVQQLWANFIKTGKPVPEGSDLPSWPAVSSRWSPHMSLEKEVVLKESLLLERGLFWEDIYDKYYREPIAPPIPQGGNSAGRHSAKWLNYSFMILLLIFWGQLDLQ